MFRTVIDFRIQNLSYNIDVTSKMKMDRMCSTKMISILILIGAGALIQGTEGMINSTYGKPYYDRVMITLNHLILVA